MKTNDTNKLPDTPGVYFFLGTSERNRKGGKRPILYIGKATSLRSRVRSYFDAKISEKRSPWIAQMIALVDKVDYQQTDSVLEALLLESAEIKKHQPPYNTREKDDKSYLYIVITDEDFPRVLMNRGSGDYGPFPYGSELREALKIIRKIFPFRDKCKPDSGKACFNAQLGLCPGVCNGQISAKDYGKTIRHLKLFFAGKKSQLIKQLEREMKVYAKSQEFEKAGERKRQIFALNHIQDVALIKREAKPISPARVRIEAYDIAHISGTNTVGAMVVMQDGELDKNSYRKFKLKGKSAEKSDDIGNLREILERRFNHPEWPLPNQIVVDGGQAQINVAKSVLGNRGLKIEVIGVIKDNHHRAIKGYPAHLVRLNQEVHRFALAYHRNRRDRVL